MMEKEKEPKIYGNKFRYRRLKYNDDNRSWISKKRSSFKGHIVDALVLEGDEGRDKLR